MHALHQKLVDLERRIKKVELDLPNRGRNNNPLLLPLPVTTDPSQGASNGVPQPALVTRPSPGHSPGSQSTPLPRRPMPLNLPDRPRLNIGQNGAFLPDHRSASSARGGEKVAVLPDGDPVPFNFVPRQRGNNAADCNGTGFQPTQTHSSSRPGVKSRSAKHGKFGMVPPHYRKSIDTVQVERRLAEIEAKSGHITINNVTYIATRDDLQKPGRELGQGTCGMVYKMLFKPAKELIAVKQMGLTGSKQENKRILMDLDVVLHCQHPDIVTCYGYFKAEGEVWICMELMATCFENLKKHSKKPIPEEILGKLAISILRALQYLKQHHEIIHRDVKPSNMLIDWKGAIKLCDFGISGRLVDSKARTREAGCSAYLAPERIQPPDEKNPDYDIRADVWSLGISLVELATGRHPYGGCDVFSMLCRVVNDDPPLITPTQGFTKEFCHFVTRCLTKDFEHRPFYKELLQDPFIERYKQQKVHVEYWLSLALTEMPEDACVDRAPPIPPRPPPELMTPP